MNLTQRSENKMPQDTFDVYLNGKHIDALSVKSGTYDREEMKASLVNHDGYDPSIQVKKRKARKNSQ